MEVAYDEGELTHLILFGCHWILIYLLIDDFIYIKDLSFNAQFAIKQLIYNSDY